MTVRCPRCASDQPQPPADAGSGARMIRCAGCGTRWLARPYEGLLPLAKDCSDIADAVVIEEVSPTSLRLLPPPPRVKTSPPAWRRARIDRRLTAVGVVFAVAAALFIFRAPIVSALPNMERLPVEVGLLEFRNVRSETVALRGFSTLFVEGEIVNRSPRLVDLPAVRITLRSPSGEPVRSWVVELAAESLGAGRSIGFRSALASPPPDAAQVTLNLSHRGGQVGYD